VFINTTIMVSLRGIVLQLRIIVLNLRKKLGCGGS